MEKKITCQAPISGWVSDKSNELSGLVGFYGRANVQMLIYKSVFLCSLKHRRSHRPSGSCCSGVVVPVHRSHRKKPDWPDDGWLGRDGTSAEITLFFNSVFPERLLHLKLTSKAEIAPFSSCSQWSWRVCCDSRVPQTRSSSRWLTVQIWTTL